MNLPNIKVTAAIIFGLLLVGVSFIFSRESAPTDASQSVNVLVNTEAGRTFIPIGDSDGDGVPDWQETLPTKKGDDSATRSRTEILAAELAQLMLNTDIPGAGSHSTSSLVSNTVNSLVGEAVDRQYTSADVKVSPDNSLLALRTYGNEIAKIAIENSVLEGSEDELTILDRSFTTGDENELRKLDGIINSYSKMVDEMQKTSVPSSMVSEHLALTNVYQALEEDIRAFRRVYDDALPAMLRFRRYPQDANALYTAISNIYLKLHESGIQWNESDTASRFISVEIR